MSRTPVSSRLESLLSSSPPSSTSSTRPHIHGDGDSLSVNSVMHRTPSATRLNLIGHAPAAKPTTQPRASSSPRPRPISLASPIQMQTDDLVSKSPIPVLRWLGDCSNGLPVRSPSRSLSSTPSPPLPGLSLLKDALHEPLSPSFPPSARLPDSFHASRNLSHPPPFLDNLTRSTLPTASLSPPHVVSTHPPPLTPITFNDPLDSPSIILTHSPPTRSSLDSLRSVSLRGHDRSMHTSVIVSPNRSTSPTNWWWFQPENKDNVDTLLIEDDRADTVQQEQDNIRKKYRSPKNPIVFCHGLLGFDTVTIGPAIAPLQVTHWRGIKEVLEANGAQVLITRVPATSSPVDRATVLEQKISEVYPGKSVHLIGHSMGGLDCRYLTTHLTQRKFNVLSITTVATPHRGSSFADHFLSTVGRTRMPSVLSLLDLLPNGGGDGAAFESLTLESMRKFNEETPNVEGVKYFSWGAEYDPGLIDTWKWPHSVILEKEGPNDGLVSVESSKWGAYLGTLSQVNHLELTGWINPARYKWAEMMGKEIKFRPATFYLGVVDMLAGEVEGQVRAGGGERERGSGSKDGGTKIGRGEMLGASELQVPEGRIEKRVVESLAPTGASVGEVGCGGIDVPSGSK